MFTSDPNSLPGQYIEISSFPITKRSGRGKAKLTYYAGTFLSLAQAVVEVGSQPVL
jgi:hypothetical protein